MKNWPILLILILPLYACELFDDAVNTSGPDIAAGLKEALEVGTDSATSRLSAVNGYLRDEAIKILLPDEIEEKITAFKAFNINVPLVGNISGEDVYNTGFSNSLIGVDIQSLSGLEETLITGINRAAESAAEDAGPIFKNAILGMSFSDANNILFGADNAATQFFKDNTSEGLFSVYEPKIDQAINTVTIGDDSVEDLYNSFVNSYNNALNTDLGVVGTLGSLASLETISETDLSTHATNKGLDGLFLKVEEVEADIRTDPLARVTDLLKDVFGLQD